MKKWMITFATASQDEVIPTMVVNISSEGATVTYPKDSGIEVEPLLDQAHIDLVFRLPHTNEEFHLICKDNPMLSTCTGPEFVATPPVHQP